VLVAVALAQTAHPGALHATVNGLGYGFARLARLARSLTGTFGGTRLDKAGEDLSRHGFLTAEWLQEAGARSRWSTPSCVTRTSNTAPT
jgi:hypothetical protein